MGVLQLMRLLMVKMCQPSCHSWQHSLKVNELPKFVAFFFALISDLWRKTNRGLEKGQGVFVLGSPRRLRLSKSHFGRECKNSFCAISQFLHGQAFAIASLARSPKPSPNRLGRLSM